MNFNMIGAASSSFIPRRSFLTYKPEKGDTSTCILGQILMYIKTYTSTLVQYRNQYMYIKTNTSTLGTDTQYRNQYIYIKTNTSTLGTDTQYRN